jgi:hypothetical protein
MMTLAQLVVAIDLGTLAADERALYRARVADEAKLPSGQLFVRTDAKSEDDYVLDAIAHHVYNVLRTPGPPTRRPAVRSRPKLEIINALPQMLDAEVAWRTAAKANDALATALAYWDRAESINPFDPLPAKILDVLQHAGICSQALRDAIELACETTEPVPGVSPLEENDLADATFADVRAVLAGAN